MKTSKAIKQFIQSCRAKGLSTRTITWYAGILNKLASSYPELPLKPKYLEKFLLSCTAGDERRHGYYRTLRVFYYYAEKRLDLISNPIRQIDAPHRKKKLPRPITKDNLEQLLLFPHPGRIKASLLFLADTGVRVGEIASLKPLDIFETPWGFIARVNGKTGMRLVPVSKEAIDCIVKFLPLNVSNNRLSRLLARAFREARVPGTAHCLRHTFGSMWEGDISALQRIMGHSNINTTMMYRLLQTKKLSLEHQLYSPLRIILPKAKNML